MFPSFVMQFARNCESFNFSRFVVKRPYLLICLPGLEWLKRQWSTAVHLTALCARLGPGCRVNRFGRQHACSTLHRRALLGAGRITCEQVNARGSCSRLGEVHFPTGAWNGKVKSISTQRLVCVNKGTMWRVMRLRE